VTPNDPGEMRNVAGDPAHREALEPHRERLRCWCERTADPFDLDAAVRGP
jgi:hypothetical protein